MLYKFEEWPQILDKKDSQIVSGHFFLLRKGRGTERNKMMWTTSLALSWYIRPVLICHKI